MVNNVREQDGWSVASDEVKSLFGRLRISLRMETRHERDIVQLDLEGLEEVALKLLFTRSNFFYSDLNVFCSHLEKVRRESQKLHKDPREAVLADLARLEDLFRKLPIELNQAAEVGSEVPRSEKERGEGMYKYFLSYSQKDAAEADHLESLLLRQARPVLRDEVHFQAGRDLNESISERIREANTFLALWSKRYKTSSWCLGELSYVKDLADKSLLESRIVIIELDDEEIPPRFTNVLRLSGRDRSQRELAMVKLVREE